MKNPDRRQAAGRPALPAFALCLVLGACGFPPPESSEEREAASSCRQDVERSFDAQHRDYLAQRDSVDTPYSGSTPPPLPSDGLSDRYAYDSDIDTCMKRSAAVPVQGPAQ